jgi:uncharacterized protein
VAHISLITLGVDDVEQAAAFYAAMGWRRSAASVDGTVAFLAGGAAVLSLFGREDLARETGVAPSTDGGSSVALAMNVRSEEAVDETLAAAVVAGGSVTRAARRADWGGYSGYFADPDGHLWEVAYNPGFALLPDGRVQLPGVP